MKSGSPVNIGTRRELFIDRTLIDTMENCRLVMHEPRDEGPVLNYDQPWEGVHSGCESVHKVDGGYRLYYRGMPDVRDGDPAECTCMATSPDGIAWTRPELDLFEIDGSKRNNAILAHRPPFSHNFMPFLDSRPDVEDGQRFKAVAGISRAGGLFAFVSGDGIRWERCGDEPILTHPEFAFDSANLAFWSAHEQCYACYFRTWKEVAPETKIRWISRAVSDDFLHWSPTEEMTIRHGDGLAPPEQLYTNATQPYFRAPHIYTAMPRRFMNKQTVLGDKEADALGVAPAQRDSCSDTLLMTSRGGNAYDRTFLEAFMRPGSDRHNWSSRAGTVGAGIIQTGAREISLYRSEHYGSPSAHLKRYSLRLDGFASVNAGYETGRLVTTPLVLEGSQLTLNYSTSAAGHVRVALQKCEGTPVAGRALEDSPMLIGDEIERSVTWKDGGSIEKIAGASVRLAFEIRDADVFAFQCL